MPVVKSKMSVDSAMTIKSNIAKKEERNINMQNNLASMIKEKNCSSWILTELLLWEVNFFRVQQTFFRQ